jgi:type II secretory pathway pseudopilin PulG
LDEGGYILAVLLIGMAVSAVWMSALLPAWRQQVIRERETELIFRGEQYARAIALFRARNQRNPTSIDELLSGHFLRKKYLDPVTGEEFIYLGAGIQSSGPLASNPIPTRVGQRPSAPPVQPPPTNEPGIYGVQSKSNATSIKIYQGQQQHSLWPFTFVQANARGIGQTGRGTGPGQGAGPGRGGDGRGGQPGRGGGPGRGGTDIGGRGRGPGQGPGRGRELPPIGRGQPGRGGGS